jgi:DNA polymerase IV
MAELDFPAIYLLPTHIDPDKLPELQSQIPTLTYDINEAEVVLGKISRRERAIFELRRRDIATTEVASNANDTSQPSPKRRMLENSRRAPEARADTDGGWTTRASAELQVNNKPGVGESVVQVVNLAWFTDSVSRGVVLPVDTYLVYQGNKQPPSGQDTYAPNASDILRRANNDGENALPHHGQPSHHGHVSTAGHVRTSPSTKRSGLARETTSEDDLDSKLPPIPKYLRTNYSCERPTPSNPPNEAFIEQLKKIRTTRALRGDKTGIRAYSTSIAALAAYPHLVKMPHGKIYGLPRYTWS